MNAIHEHSAVMFGLSTCGHCKRVRMLFEHRGVRMKIIYVDLLSGNKREEALDEMSRYNPEMNFPTTIIDNRDIVLGDDLERIDAIIGQEQHTVEPEILNTNAHQREITDALRARLRPFQEKSGYFFNAHSTLVDDMLWQLHVNKERYGYMLCPCRLTGDTREKDADIICPCSYRTADVAEYGSCYCGLYVGEAWKNARHIHTRMPERRPRDKRRYALHNEEAE